MTEICKTHSFKIDSDNNSEYISPLSQVLQSLEQLDLLGSNRLKPKSITNCLLLMGLSIVFSLSVDVRGEELKPQKNAICCEVS